MFYLQVPIAAAPWSSQCLSLSKTILLEARAAEAVSCISMPHVQSSYGKAACSDARLLRQGQEDHSKVH